MSLTKEDLVALYALKFHFHYHTRQGRSVQTCLATANNFVDELWTQLQKQAPEPLIKLKPQPAPSQILKIVNVSETPKRKRGRPRKIKNGEGSI